MIGFPEFILDPKELDDVYDGVSGSVGALLPPAGQQQRHSLCSVSVRRFRRQLLPEHAQLLQLLSKSDGRPAEEDSQQRPVMLTCTDTTCTHEAEALRQRFSRFSEENIHPSYMMWWGVGPRGGGAALMEDPQKVWMVQT